MKEIVFVAIMIIAILTSVFSMVFLTAYHIFGACRCNHEAIDYVPPVEL